MAGIYIHIPFCEKRCSYCDFHFSTNFSGYKTQMVNALIKELEMRSHPPEDELIETVYFGGGTPSLLSLAETGRLLSAVNRFYEVSPDAEITFECNPENCTDENLSGWKSLGINRLSIGLQSFTEEQLLWMNRTHTANEGVEAVKRAGQNGFTNLTVDIMYGLPDLSLSSWLEQLQQVLALDVSHISAYCLTIEEKTPLAKWVKAGKIHPAAADLQSDQFELLQKELGNAGYEQYEISNFACNGHYSRHNSSYWRGSRYIGIGPSAHGYNGSERYWNVASNHQYMNAIGKGELNETREVLSANDRFNELLLTGLRTKWGVDKNSLFAQLDPPENWFARLEYWKGQGKLTESGTELKLTEEGKLLADAIASDLFEL